MLFHAVHIPTVDSVLLQPAFVCLLPFFSLSFASLFWFLLLLLFKILLCSCFSSGYIPACVVCWYQSVVAEGGFCVLVSEEDDRRLCQNPDCRLRDTATRVSNFPFTQVRAHKLNVAFLLGKTRQHAVLGKADLSVPAASRPRDC